ncbi:hypothetical protein [Citricoccus nitrophenolicus]|uniref:hypothetical protein n=1 Tax=Citricoccus nitrophenolicus TaxID=863575 RepID=UPI0031E4FB0E
MSHNQKPHPLGSGLMFRVTDIGFEPAEVLYLNLTPREPGTVSAAITPDDFNDPNTAGCYLRTLIDVIDGDTDTDLRFEFQSKDDLDLAGIPTSVIRELLLDAAETSDREYEAEEARLLA